MLVMMAVLVLIGVGVLVGGVIISRRSSDAFVEERLGITEEQTAGTQAQPGEKSSPIGDALDRALAERGIGAELATKLARADLKITVGEFMAATFILMAFLGGVSYVFKGDTFITAGACLLGFFGPRIYVGMLQGRRLNSFNDQLSDTINLMVNSIRAGYSIMQAMEAVSEEMAPPIATEFGRVVQEVQLGIPLEEAMNHMLRRVPSEDLDMMITAINVQREVGGNLAEVLESISFTIRERIRIKGELKALTGQSRISGYMVAMVPVGLAFFIYFINRDFMMLLFTDICGNIMLGVAVVGIGMGFFVINKVMDIEV